MFDQELKALVLVLRGRGEIALEAAYEFTFFSGVLIPLAQRDNL